MYFYLAVQINHTNSSMEKKSRKDYVTPVTDIIEVKMEGVIATSSDPLSSPAFYLPFEGGGEDW